MSSERQWHKQEHIDAGYHEQEWGPIPSPKSELIGDYQADTGVITVRRLPVGPSGNPELELEWEDGSKVTVLDEATALLYLLRDGAVTVEDDA